MAEANRNSSHSENENNELDLGHPGHTMSDGSSTSQKDVTSSRKKRLVKKRRWVPKLVVEKHPATSSDESEKENKRKKLSDSSPSYKSDGSESEVCLSPLYQNQEGHPDFPFIKSEVETESDVVGNCSNI